MPDHHRSGRGGDVAGKHYAVTSNVPVEIRNPQRKARLIAAAWVVALVMCSFAAAFAATRIAIAQNDDSRAQLQAELDQRARQRDAEAQRFQHALDQYRIDQCHITALLPQDPAIVDIRTRYRCDNPVATPAPSPSTSSVGPGGARPPAAPTKPPARPPPAGAPRPTRNPPPPAPAAPNPVPPVPVPPPSPSPAVCLPLLGICLF